MMNPENIYTFFKTLHDENPHPKTELEYTNSFTLLVAVVLSAQATDKGVNKATKELFKIAQTPKQMLELGLEGVKEHIRTIGLFNSKAQNIIKLCDMLVTQHDSQVPQTREELEALPGVGRKTANVVLNVAFGHPTMAVDTHIFRVGNRTGIAYGRSPLEVEKMLLEHIPQDFMVHAHHWLILLGRYICKARKPECWRCPVSDVCLYDAKTTP